MNHSFIIFTTDDEVYVERKDGTDDDPLNCKLKQCGFTGFLMKPN